MAYYQSVPHILPEVPAPDMTEDLLRSMIQQPQLAPTEELPAES